MATIYYGVTNTGTTSGRSTSGFRCSRKEETIYGSISGLTMSGPGGMVSLIGWIVTMGSCEDSVIDNGR